MESNLENVKALTFDVFGTVVDWRSSIIREGQQLTDRFGYKVDWAEFADLWRAGYAPAMDRVRTGELPWTKIDDLHLMILEELVPQFGLDDITAEELFDFNKVWHRLTPWPDSVEGLTRLKGSFIIGTLSNGNVSLLTNMAKFGNLPWDVIFSAEIFGHYKPDPETYLGSAELLGLDPKQVMMVAAHSEDLREAAKSGLKTAYVSRPFEYGPRHHNDDVLNEDFDVVANDFLDLAKKLGA
tara:strand:- start:726 stop:1445 length:720 start_codon:yes stop_codon:yes gene_type:complete